MLSLQTAHESFEVHIWGDSWKISRIPYSSKGNQCGPIESERHSHDKTPNISQRIEVLHRKSLLHSEIHTGVSSRDHPIHPIIEERREVSMEQ